VSTIPPKTNFIQEKNTIVGQAYFSRCRMHRTTEKTGIGDGMMGRSEWTRGNELPIAIQLSADIAVI
jgi:hypothetical protein